MLKVLVIDDETVVRRGIVLGVDWAAMGCVVVGEAANGQEGLLAVERYSPNLIITDVRMPKMDGIEMLRRPIDQKEVRMLKSILKEGENQGLFAVADFDVAANIALYAMKGLEVPYTRQKLAHTMNDHKKEIAYFLVNGFSRNPSVNVNKATEDSSLQK